jgi:hypothetical protein
MPRGVYVRRKDPWNKGKTKETDERVAKNAANTKATVLSRYGTTTVLNSKEVLDKTAEDRHSGKLAQKAMHTKEKRYGDRHYNNMEKSRQTKLDRYGDENYNNPQQNKETSQERYGVDHYNQTPEGRKKIADGRVRNNSAENAKQTIIAKYGDLETYYDIVSCKRYETMRKNGTLGFKETQPERELYQKLCQEYGEENVIKQYYDKERYPFKCDFYVIPEDKFIELHGFWTHGPHPFDKNDPKDIELLLQLEDEQTEWSKAIIYTWTDLDVRKLETAKKNNLNYETIYWYDK